jgi:hypothetical protein
MPPVPASTSPKIQLPAGIGEKLVSSCIQYVERTG